MKHFLALHKWLIGSLAAASAVVFLATLIALPLIIVALRPDYFSAPHREPGPWRQRHPFAGLLVSVMKNVGGALFMMAGVVMLFTPGQGLLCMFIGLTMMNYPGKYRLERWLVVQPPIWRALTWLRDRAHVVPLIHPDAPAPGETSAG